MTRASAAAGAAVAVLVCCALGAAAAQDDSSSCPPLSYANASALLAGPRAANALALPMCARCRCARASANTHRRRRACAVPCSGDASTICSACPDALAKWILPQLPPGTVLSQQAAMACLGDIAPNLLPIVPGIVGIVSCDLNAVFARFTAAAPAPASPPHSAASMTVLPPIQARGGH